MNEFDKLKENIKIDPELIRLIEFYIGDIYKISTLDEKEFEKFKGKVELLNFLKSIQNKK